MDPPPPTSHRRLRLGVTLALAIGGIKLIEDVAMRESGPADEAVLWWMRDHVPPVLTPFFTAVSPSGSAGVLLPLSALALVVMLLAGRRFEAVLVGSSMLAAALFIWATKALVGRTRPALWEAPWAWGSSFPSGHTLATAALSTALALSVARIVPRAAGPAVVLAALWTILVAASRLVLGMHWPSDVLAAMCIGASFPLLLSLAHDLSEPSPPRAATSTGDKT